jgi:tryptophanyl-tRNA synthetase
MSKLPVKLPGGFNYLYGDVFPEPEAILTKTSKILGLDRRKMSKSYNNAIYLSDTPDEISRKVSQMITDPQRMRRSDPGNPDICNVFEFHKIYSDKKTWEDIDPQCRNAQIGCVQCKQIMAKNLIEAMKPMHERRAQFQAKPERVREIIDFGSEKARNDRQKDHGSGQGAIRIKD